MDDRESLGIAMYTARIGEPAIDTFRRFLASRLYTVRRGNAAKRVSCGIVTTYRAMSTRSEAEAMFFHIFIFCSIFIFSMKSGAAMAAPDAPMATALPCSLICLLLAVGIFMSGDFALCHLM